MLLTRALVLSASQFVHKKSSLRFFTSMHSGGLELTQFTYSRHEDNLLHTTGATGCVLQQWYNSSQCSSLYSGTGRRRGRRRSRLFSCVVFRLRKCYQYAVRVHPQYLGKKAAKTGMYRCSKIRTTASISKKTQHNSQSRVYIKK